MKHVSGYVTPEVNQSYEELNLVRSKHFVCNIANHVACTEKERLGLVVERLASNWFRHNGVRIIEKVKATEHLVGHCSCPMCVSI